MTDIFAPEFREQFTARQLSPVSAVPSPFPMLNDFSGDEGGKVGTADGWFVVVGGNPKHGKTILAINWLWSALASGRSPMFVSLEMSQWQVATRLYAMMTRTDLWKIEKRGFRREQFNELWRELDPIRNDLTLYVDDTPLVRTDEIIASMQRHADEGADFFVVDYLQLAALGNSEQINEAVVIATTNLRHFAKTVCKPVIVLSQFNRQTSMNYTDTPMPQGLHGGMIVEASADQILLIDHSRYEKLPGKARTWLTVTNRHGPSDDIPIEYIWETQTVQQGDEDLEEQWPTNTRTNF
jgi:replicative DNA helicase